MIDIQYGIIVMGGREVSRPYRVCFFAEGEWFLSFWRCHRPRKRAALPQITNQRDGSFGLYMPKANQKNRPFGLWFMWFAWNQTCHSTNDRCEALASLKGCFFCFCFSPPVSPSSILWGGEIYKCKCWARRSNRRFSALSAVVNNFFCNLQNLSGLNL